MSSLSLQVHRDAARVVIEVHGELDLATVPELREIAGAELGSSTCETLVLELAGLTFLDSTGIGCWIELRNQAQDAGKSLQLHAIPPAARRTVTIAGLAPVFGLGTE